MTARKEFDWDQFWKDARTCDGCGDESENLARLPSFMHLKEDGSYCEVCRGSFEELHADVQDIGKLVSAALSTWRNHRRAHACGLNDCQHEKYLYENARNLERLSGETYRRARYFWKCPKCGWEYDGEIGYEQGHKACPDCWIEERHLWGFGWRYLRGR